jgi:hypothetical protein
MGPLDHPPAARLDRRRQPTSGDLAHHGPLGQHLPTRLVVVAGVQVYHRPLGQHPDQAKGVQRHRQQPVVAGDAAVAAAEHQHLMSLSKTIRSGMRGRWQPSGWVSGAGGRQGGDLDPQGFQDGRWQGRHEIS